MPSERELRRKIDRIKKQLARLGELRPGTLTEQFNVCGSEGCQCKTDPQYRHGPYYQLSYTRKGRSRTEFVRKENLRETKKQISNYQTLRKLVDEWIDTSIELAALNRQSRGR